MKDLLQELQSAKTLQDLDNIRSKWLGKKSEIKAHFDALKKMSADQKQALGAELNMRRAAIEESIESARNALAADAIAENLANDNFDISLPGHGTTVGALHPVSIIEQKCTAVLRRMGFVVAEGPEIDTAENVFDLLDIPKYHPARDMQDSFWIDQKNGILLRSHTTSVQSREMMKLRGDESKLPIKILSPGRVYRNEAVDATHLAAFHQYEGLWIGHCIRLSHLKGILIFILQEVFGQDVKFRFKPKYYPYTEPSIGADVDLGNGWLTIVGAGMVSPQVLRNFGLNPARVSGLAFGFGLSRLASLFTGANMRELYGMDLRIMEKLK